MKIPAIKSPGVAPAPVRAPSLSVVTDNLGAAVASAGAQADSAMTSAAASFEKIQAEFEAADASELITEKQKRTTDRWDGESPTQKANLLDSIAKVAVGPEGQSLEVDRPAPGFSATKGERSLAGLNEHLKTLDDDTREIAGKAKSERARKLFLDAASRLDLHSYGQAKGHVARELERSKADKLKANLAETLRYAGLRPEDDEGVNLRIAQTAGAAVGMSSSDEDAVNKVESIRASVATTRARELIRLEDYDKAEAVVKQSERALGEDAGPLLEKIAKGREAGEMNELAQSIVRTARQEDGKVNEVSAWKGVAALDGEMQKKLSPVLTAYLAHERKAWDEQTEAITNGAASEYLLLQRDRGPQAWSAFARSELGERLRIRNWKVYNQLQNGVESDLAREERLSRIRANDSQARREQAEIDKIIQNRWETTLKRDPNANLATFLATEGRQGSRWMPSELEKDQVTKQELVKRGLLTKQTEFVKRAMDNAEGFLPNIVGTPQQRAQARTIREDFEAKAGRAYAKASLAQKDGADLSEADAAKLITDLVAEKLVPHTDDSINRAAEAILERANRPQAPEMLRAPKKVTVIGPDGKSALADEAGLDVWLKAHPKWKRK